MSAALILPQTATPTISEFDPRVIPYQYRVIRDVRKRFDYSLGVHECLLSGSVGSAKSILMAHIFVTHCLNWERARVGIGRRSMPDLKSTLLAKILEHMENDLVEGEDYEHNETKGEITFSNGSQIISRSWSDKRYKRFRSLELSAAGIEELTENNDEDKQAYDELKMRVGRLSHVKENIMISATNPDAPSHWAHKYFIESTLPTRHVYYSVTTDNPFLPKWYVDQLLTDLDPKMAQRMIYGRWIEISGEVIYYSYNREVNFKNEPYQVKSGYPIHMSFDFNIAENKPMSAVFFQYIEGTFHFFDECIVHGARTESLMDEAAGRGLFEHKNLFIINGDATGRARSPASKSTNYDVIREFLANFTREDRTQVQFDIQVPKANPPIRKRHNTVNAQFKNARGEVHAFVYEKCKVLDEGLRLTKLKKGGEYVEDDSKHYQHVTTALGYGVMSCVNESLRPVQGMRQL